MKYCKILLASVITYEECIVTRISQTVKIIFIKEHFLTRLILAEKILVIRLGCHHDNPVSSVRQNLFVPSVIFQTASVELILGNPAVMGLSLQTVFYFIPAAVFTDGHRPFKIRDETCHTSSRTVIYRHAMS